MRILCAGPTTLTPEVEGAMQGIVTNPDLDPEYEVFHRRVEKKLSRVVGTERPTVIMLGEGMLALEASVCSLMEKGERVLVMTNGVFGAGFADYVKFFGGEAVIYDKDHRHGFDVDELRDFLEEDSDFAIATMVHCETPSGLTNDMRAICRLLKDYGILSIVDCVSSFGGEAIDFDKDGVDMMLSASQKCLSAPTGLSMITISEAAENKMRRRAEPIPSYYMNVLNYMSSQEDFAFPYTMSEHLTYALDKALDRWKERDAVRLHRVYGELTRKLFIEEGFELYPKDSYSDTVTAVVVPEGMTATDLLKRCREKGVFISKGVGPLHDRIFRIGHMGANITEENFRALFHVLDEVFGELGRTTHFSERFEQSGRIDS
ncbi:MAG: alanine--glyoxylate aminotransferase family protein [Peptoniphilus sp.]|nr:alanine--glyoxylate aminotransferase family protein [Peptoniphilus sp.]MDD7363157.1 alanine--glyoxylate aminotransferase family protein [Bacillota bacterium]MDY6044519.1 alanine--glyoxylate aminotransferase family protein [Peptoniphilus sp.]